MIIYLIRMFGFSLVLTILIELLIAKLILRPMDDDKKRLVILVNILTNPPAVLIIWIIRMFVSYGWGLILQIPIELLVIIVEAVVYLQFAKKDHWRIKRPVCMALIGNSVSWIAGILLQLLA